MRTDYKEERKWKRAMAYTIAHAVLEWHMTDDKSTVCVKVKMRVITIITIIYSIFI